jgi:hypothetical protein
MPFMEGINESMIKTERILNKTRLDRELYDWIEVIFDDRLQLQKKRGGNYLSVRGGIYLSAIVHKTRTWICLFF